MGDHSARTFQQPEERSQQKEGNSSEEEVKALRMQNHQLRAELDKMDALLDEERAEAASWKARFWKLKRKELEDSKRH